jgi:hypothetical protein
MRLLIISPFENAWCRGPIWLIALTLAIAVGCGKSKPYTGDPTMTISWEEFENMDAEEQDDPYVIENLDENAQTLLEQRNSKSRQ